MAHASSAHASEPVADGTIHAVGTLWTLERDDRTAVCILLAARRATEVRVLIDGDTLLSQRCERHSVFGVAENWKKRLMERGWIGRSIGIVRRPDRRVSA
jgi:hypothetical protein